MIIEERLSGPEVSLLAFSDGVPSNRCRPRKITNASSTTIKGPTPAAWARMPRPRSAARADRGIHAIRTAAIVDCREEGRPFSGVLYAGLMLTADGPRVLEYNCRFGDPETQAILPLLETDLLEIALACVEGNLDKVAVEWQAGSAACVVVAAKGYPAAPELGEAIHGMDALPEKSCCFHAGTAR